MRAIFRSNLFRIAILLWFSAWLLVVMPGHTRGIVRMPGSVARAAQSSCCEPAPSCCATETASDGCDGDTPQPPEDPARHCAICFLKAHLTDPPPTNFYTPFLGELDELDYAPFASVFDDQSQPMHARGRGPPA